MTSAFALRSMVLVLLGGASAALQAAPTHLTTGQVGIDFDTDGSSWYRDVHAFGGVTSEVIPWSSLTLTPVANGFEVNFNDLMSVYATSYANFSPETLTGVFSSVFNFTPAEGYVITGYQVTYTGNYSIEDPGFVSLRGPGYGFNGYALSGPIDYVGAEPASGAFRLDLSISAFADVVTRQVFDGYDTYLDHYETVLDYCEAEEPFTCYYREEPVYITQPIYRYETDLGEASINVRTVMVQANVALVPEPSGHGLLLAGLSLVGWRLWRRRA